MNSFLYLAGALTTPGYWTRNKSHVMKKILLIATIALVSYAASAGEQRSVPLTSEALAVQGHILDSMPAEWELLGYVQPTPATEIRYSLLGVGGETLCRDFADFKAYESYLEPLGAKRIRLQSGWAKTEKIRGEYDFAWLDYIIDNSIRCGVEPWLELSYGNPIYPGAGGVGLGEGLIQSEEGFAAWERYVTEAVKRYADKVYYYEVWNEADIRQHDGKASADQSYKYPMLFERTAKIIRKHDPDSYIVGLALAGVNRQQTVTVFFEYLNDRGILDLVDAISIHGYPQNPDANMDSVERIQSFIDQYDPGITVWQGETGAPSQYQEKLALSGIEWTELSQAKYNTRRALAHIGRNIPFSMFQISDMYYKQKQRDLNLLNNKGLLKAAPDLSIERPKLAYYSYQNLCSLFRDGNSPLGKADFESANPNLVVFRFHESVRGRSGFVLWDQSGKPSESYDRERTSVSLADFRISDPVYVDLVSGAVINIPKDSVQRFGTTAYIRGLPIWDGPVLVTDKMMVPLIKVGGH